MATRTGAYIDTLMLPFQILFARVTQERLRGIENVAQAWIHRVVSNKRVKYNFWANCSFKDKREFSI